MGKLTISKAHMSMFDNNALLGGGVRVRVWIRKQKKSKEDQRHYKASPTLLASESSNIQHTFALWGFSFNHSSRYDTKLVASRTLSPWEQNAISTTNLTLSTILG